MVGEFLQTIGGGGSAVKQMIMGQARDSEGGMIRLESLIELEIIDSGFSSLSPY